MEQTYLHTGIWKLISPHGYESLKDLVYISINTQSGSKEIYFFN